MKTFALLAALLGCACGMYGQNSNGASLSSGSGSAAIACVATPGNTTGAYRQQCQTAGGGVYACNNAAGCALAADWVSLAGSAFTFPGAGVPNSTGSAWGGSYTVGTGNNNLVQLNGSGQLPAISAALLTNYPIFNQNTTGSAGSLITQSVCQMGATLSGSITITDTGICNVFSGTITGNITSVALSGFRTSQSYTFDFLEGGIGGFTITGATHILGLPCLVTTSGVNARFTGYYDGTNLVVVPASNDSGQGCAVAGTAPVAAPASGLITWIDPTDLRYHSVIPTTTFVANVPTNHVNTVVDGIANPSDSLLVSYIDIHGIAQRVTLTSIIDGICSAQGSVLYRGASTWACLAPGTSGFFLQTQGASANPLWATASGSGSFYQTLQANGTGQTQEAKLNLKSGTNATVTCTDNSGATSTDCTISATAGAGGYATVQQAGSNVTTQTTLNFLAPLTAVNNAGNSSTDVGVSSAVVQTGKANTYTTGAQDFTAAQLKNGIAPATYLSGSLSSDFICDATATFNGYVCTTVGTTETYFANGTTIPTAATANTVDGTHTGLDLAWVFDIVGSNSPSFTLKLNACSALSGQTCTGRVVLWVSQASTQNTAGTIEGVSMNCTLTGTATATTMLANCGTRLWGPGNTSPGFVTSVPNTGTNWVLVWSVTFGTATHNDLVAQDGRVKANYVF